MTEEDAEPGVTVVGGDGEPRIAVVGSIHRRRTMRRGGY